MIPKPKGKSMPCRLCTANDMEALAEHLAEQMWESRREPEFDPPWERTSSYWQIVMRGFASQTLKMLRDDNG
jgi:hypothetical protein